MERPVKPVTLHTQSRTRVLCVDDSHDLTAALAKLIGTQADLESAGSLHSADNLVCEVIERQAHVVVLDLGMPGVDPLDAIRELKTRVPPCAVIAFSGSDDQDTIELVKKAGACELVSKIAQAGVLLRTIRVAAYQNNVPPEASHPRC